MIPNIRNARTHSQSQIGEIEASIIEFGFTNPLLIDPEGNILAGHARLSAALSLGRETVPVIVLHHLTEIQKRAYILVDNKLPLNAEWDDELLAEEIAALERDGFEIGILGFSDEELAALLAEDQSEDTDSDVVPAPTPLEVTRLADTWLLGPHRVHCGDATSPASFDLLLAGQPADPPYGVNYQGGGREIVNDHLGDGFGDFLGRACTHLLAVTRGALYICMSSSHLHTLHSAFTDAGGHWSTFIIWEKNHFTLGRSDYQRQYEPILYGWKESGPHYWCGDRNQGDVWQVDKPAMNALHPTMRPVELVKRAIHNSSRSGQIVLDASGGAGSTLIACERTGRHARVIEIEPGYVDVIGRRAGHHWQIGNTGERRAVIRGRRCRPAFQTECCRRTYRGAVVMESQLEPDVPSLPKPWLRQAAKVGKAGTTESAKAYAAGRKLVARGIQPLKLPLTERKIQQMDSAGNQTNIVKPVNRSQNGVKKVSRLADQADMKITPGPRFEEYQLDPLIPDKRNARTRSSAQIEQFVTSIRIYGVTNPILIPAARNFLAKPARLIAVRSAGHDVKLIVLAAESGGIS